MATSDDEDFLFADESETDDEAQHSAWKILIVDDEKDIHTVTQLTFTNFQFEELPIVFLSAYSAAQAKEIVQQHDDIAVILLDVVMEEPDSGLKFVRYLREELGNNLTRIILRTGQPGYAPERSIVANYDINDYREKTELTANKFFTAVTVALRSYRDLVFLKENKQRTQNTITDAARFIPQNFLESLHQAETGDSKYSNPVKQRMTVLFFDIHATTNSSKPITAQQNAELLQAFFTYIEATIVKHYGFTDQYISASTMVLFTNSADIALTAAIELHKVLAKFNDEYQQKSQPEIKARIGINTGNVAMKAVGSNDQISCSTITDVINTAAHIEKLSQTYAVDLLISEQSLSDIDQLERFNIRYLTDVPATGKAATVKIYEVFDIDVSESIAIKQQTKSKFEQAVYDFQNGNYGSANKSFTDISILYSQDKATQVYLNKISKKLKLKHSVSE